MKRSTKVILGLSAIMVLGSGAGLLVWHETQRGAGLKVKVEAMNWSRAYVVLQKEIVSGEGWRADIAAGAFNISCRDNLPKGTINCHPRQCDPRQVAFQCRPHECNCITTWHKIGKTRYPSRHCSTCYDTCHRTAYDTCYDQCPVYDAWCRYKYPVWSSIGDVRSASDDNQPREPRIELREDQRLELTRQSYLVRFTDGEKRWDYLPAEADVFRQFDIGQYWMATVDEFGRIRPSQRLQLERE